MSGEGCCGYDILLRLDTETTRGNEKKTARSLGTEIKETTARIFGGAFDVAAMPTRVLACTVFMTRK